MKPQKGMWTDGSPKQNPESTTRVNKNVVLKDSYGAISNERGFSIYSESFGNNKTPIGQLVLDDENFIVFSIKDDGTDEIGYVNFNGDYHTVINADLGFSKNSPIHGEYQINYKGERIITWVQKDQSPKILNIDSIPNPLTLEKIELFNKAQSPIVSSELLEGGGSIETGAYYPIIQLVRDDFSTSNWFRSYLPVFITDESSYLGYDNLDGAKSGVLTSKSIKLDISNIDTSYTYIRIGFIQQKEGVKIGYLYKEVAISNSNMTINITNSTNLESIDLAEIVIDKAIYKNAKLITQDSNMLYLGDTVKYREPNYQSYVNNLVLKWCSEKVTIFEEAVCQNTTTTTRRRNGAWGNTTYSLNNGYKYHAFNNKKRHFQHGEVYAFYVRFEWSWGKSRWYVLNGRLGNSSDKQLISVSSVNCSQDVWKKYQIYDTCQTISKTANSAIGHFGFWENENETYPTQGGFPTGNVRHFKFPSLNYMRNYVYDDTSYGTSTLDILGVVLENLNLDNILDCEGNKATAFEIGYAKRNGINNTIFGQSPVIQDGANLTEELYKITPGVAPRGSATRVHPFEMLYSKISNSIQYYREEYALKSTEINQYSETTSRKGYAVIDYIVKKITSPVSTKIPNNIYSVNIEYIPNNVLTDDVDNLYQEEFVRLIGANYNYLNTGDKLYDISISPNPPYAFEKTILLSLISLKKNLYDSFNNQEIVSMGIYKTVPNKIWGGDTYICDYSYNTLGAISHEDTTDITQVDKNHKNNGRRVARRVLVESVYNINLRYVNSSVDGYTQYYPKSGFNYLNTLERDKSVNLFSLGYNTDYNALLDIDYANIWNGVDVTNYENPFMIIRSQEFNKSVKINNWRDFKQNDYYEMPKNRGRLVNLEAGRDYLYIHMEKSLFRTKSRNVTQRTSDEQDSLIYIGVGDIFQYEPFPVIHSELGELGTQHKFACLLTKYGYLFPDAEKGKWFLVNDQIKEISSNGEFNFFLNNTYCFGDNPYITDGLECVYDETFDRIIISRKFKDLKNKEKFKGIWKNDKYFLNSLQSGDIVYKDGQFKQVK